MGSIEVNVLTCFVFGIACFGMCTIEALSPGKSGLDIVLLVDTSSSIGHTSLASAKKFMKVLVDLYGVSKETTGGKNGTRFALVTFNSKATVVFNLDDRNARSENAVKASIDAIQNTGFGTDFRKALLKVDSHICIRKIELGEKARLDHATRAMFLITDAEVTSTLEANRIESIKLAADHLEMVCGFEIFAIGVEQNIDKFVVIASRPHVEHVFVLSQFKDLEKVGDIIAERNIEGNVEDMEPDQCLSKFDYDYKVMHKLIQTEMQIANQADEIKELKKANKDNHHVAFMAEMSTNMVNPATGTIVVFDMVHVNIGDSYKPGTGTFVAPVSGTYSVTVVATAERRSTSGQQLHLHLVHNSKRVGFIFLDGNTNWPLLRTISVVVELSYGDTLFVKISDISGAGTLVGCCLHTYFSGFLVKAD